MFNDQFGEDSPNFSSITATVYPQQPLEDKRGSRYSRLAETCSHVQDPITQELDEIQR